MSKAQISIYIVIAVVVIILVGIGMYVYNRSVSNIEETPLVDNSEVKNFVEDCIESKAIPLLYEMASQSGYLYLPPEKLRTEYSDVAYYFDVNRSKVINENEMRQQIQDYMNKELPKCLRDFESLTYKVEYNYLETKVVLGESDTVFIVNLPLKIEENVKTEIDTFTTKVPIRMKHLRKVSDDIVNMFVDDPLWIDFTELSAYDVDVNLLPYNKTVMVIALTDTLSSVNDDPFVYLFASRFEIHDPPEIFVDDILYMIDNENFEYNLSSNQNVSWSDDTTMFEIVNGLINFTPRVTGEFEIRIFAENEYSLKNEKEVEIIVHEES